jgi:hypothetical protein
MKPKFPAINKGMIDIPGNDSRHNQTDLNQGGSPRNVQKRVPPAQRGGFGHQGQRVHVQAGMGGARGGTGNPATRGGQSIGSMSPEKNVPGHGGSPAGKNPGLRSNLSSGFGQSGQSGVPNYGPANPQPSSGNTSGRSYRLIAGRFKRAAMGAQPSTGSGKYGSPPVSSNT